MAAASLFGLGVPKELLEYLDKIHSDVIDVKERVIRIEAQDSLNNIKKLESDLDKEKEARLVLEFKVHELKSKIAPVIGVIAVIGGAIVDSLIHLIKF